MNQRPVEPVLASHLDDDDIKMLADALQSTLLDLLDLSLWGKQAHWTVVGPRFLVLHRHLDELIASWRQMADVVAERMVTIGCWPDGQAQAITSALHHFEVPPGAMLDNDVVDMLAVCIGDVTRRTRARVERIGELDIVSQGMVADLLGELEQQLWMSRAQRSSGPA